MNGSEQRIFDKLEENGNRLTAIETFAKAHYKEIKEDVGEIKRDIKVVIRLKTQVAFQWWAIGVIVIGIMAQAWYTIR